MLKRIHTELPILKEAEPSPRESFFRKLKDRSSLILMMSALGFAGCARTNGDASHLDDLAWDSNANNVALVFGAINGLNGVTTDVSEMSRVLSDQNYGFSFKVQSNPNASKSEILATIREKPRPWGTRARLPYTSLDTVLPMVAL